MLQPMTAPKQDPFMVAKILWGALNASLVMYGGMLIFLGKITHITWPESLSDLDKIALAASAIVLITFSLQSKIKSEPTVEKKLPLWIVTWALHEAIALMGFLAVFTSESGNGLFFVMNFVIAVTANVLTFPKK